MYESFNTPPTDISPDLRLVPAEGAVAYQNSFSALMTPDSSLLVGMMNQKYNLH